MTSSEPDDRPVATIAAAWEEFRAWDHSADQLKASETKARVVALGLGVLGAFFATAAGVVGEGRLVGIEASQLLAGASAVLIATAGYVGRQLLTAERGTDKARTRLMAEAVRREVWLALMLVPPYDKSGSDRVLRERIDGFRTNIGLPRSAQQGGGQTDGPPQANTVDDYIAQRADDQAKYYETTARSYRATLSRYRRLTFVLGLLAVLLGLGGVVDAGAAIWIPVVTTASAAVVALLQASKVKDLVPLFQQTASQLGFLVAGWRDQAGDRAQKGAAEVRRLGVAFVERCEEVMSNENEAWRAGWMSEESGQWEGPSGDTS